MFAHSGKQMRSQQQQGYDAKEKGKMQIAFRSHHGGAANFVSWQWVAGGLRDASLLHDPITSPLLSPLIN